MFICPFEESILSGSKDQQPFFSLAALGTVPRPLVWMDTACLNHQTKQAHFDG